MTLYTTLNHSDSAVICTGISCLVALMRLPRLLREEEVKSFPNILILIVVVVVVVGRDFSEFYPIATRRARGRGQKRNKRGFICSVDDIVRNNRTGRRPTVATYSQYRHADKYMSPTKKNCSLFRK